MDLVVTVVAPDGAEIADAALAALAAAGLGDAPRWLAPRRACDFPVAVAGDHKALAARVGEALAPFAIDHAVLPARGRRKRLLVADMDSTIISQECIDELAAAVGVGAEVADITARAMAGELDFEGALLARVALLKGAPADVIETLLESRITANPGAAMLVATMRAHGAHTLLVSGGFTQFVEPVAARLGFDETRANRLTIENGRLTGDVARPVLGRNAKRAALEETCRRLGIATANSLAVGDGANDLEMVAKAGLGVAYHAKPVLAARADARIEHGDLTALLFFQGYRGAELVA